MSLGFNLKSVISGFTFLNSQDKDNTKERVKIESEQVENLEVMLQQENLKNGGKTWYA